MSAARPDLSALEAALAALDKVVAIAQLAERRMRQANSPFAAWLSDAGMAEFSMADDAIAHGCFSADIERPAVEPPRSGIQALGFTGLHFLVGARKRAAERRTIAVRTRRSTRPQFGGSAGPQFAESFAPMPTRRWFESMRVLRTRLELAVDASKASDGTKNSGVPGLQESGASKAITKPKRSTESLGERKWRSALLTHHAYENGGCGNLEPISLRELKNKYGVPKPTASRFFKKHFGGHESYEHKCRQPGLLAFALKLLAGEVYPKHLDLDSRRDGEDDGES